MSIKNDLIESVSSFEDIYAKGYNKSYPSIELVRISSKLNLPKKSKILDFGCGPGTNGIHFLNKQNRLFFADISENALKLVKSKINKKNLLNTSFNHIDPTLDKLPFEDNFFDLIICMSVYNNFVNRKYANQMLNEFNRVLNKKAFLILDFNLKENNYKNIKSLKNNIKKTIPNDSTDKQISMYFPTSNKSVINDLKKNSFKILDIGYSHWKIFDNFEHESIITSQKI